MKREFKVINTYPVKSLRDKVGVLDSITETQLKLIRLKFNFKDESLHNTRSDPTTSRYRWFKPYNLIEVTGESND